MSNEHEHKEYITKDYIKRLVGIKFLCLLAFVIGIPLASLWAIIDAWSIEGLPVIGISIGGLIGYLIIICSACIFIFYWDLD